MRRYDGVTAFVGMPGSGKTYALAQTGLGAMKAGRQVWCNAGFDLAGAEVFSSMEEFLAVPNGSTIVFDEAPIYFNARRWQDFPDALLYRLTQIRKDGLQFFYSTIDWQMVDVTLRRLTFWTWECHAVTGRLLVRAKYPIPERRQKDEGPRRRQWSYVHGYTARSYDTVSKVAAPARTALTASQGAAWVRPGALVLPAGAEGGNGKAST